MVFGASFSPEYCEGIGIKDPLEVLKFVHKKLGIKDIRLGLRWNRIDNGNELSLDYYRRYLDYLFDNDINVCLNVGPIKVFRWPEEHIPVYLNSYVTKYIYDSSKLANKAKEYFANLVHILSEEYGSKMNDVCFQIENEAFNRFGHISTKMSPEYVFSLVSILFQRFPNARLMMDSAGRTNLRILVNLFERISSVYTPKSLTLGINYYFRLPQTLPFFKRINPIKFSYPWDMSLKTVHKKGDEIGFNIEVSEGQFEPWGVQNTPGNSYEDFVYLVERSKEIISGDGILRLWGVEEFAQKFLEGNSNKEHEKILKMINSIAM
jgi:hypothetical protein